MIDLVITTLIQRNQSAPRVTLKGLKSCNPPLNGSQKQRTQASHPDTTP